MTFRTHRHAFFVSVTVLALLLAPVVCMADDDEESGDEEEETGGLVTEWNDDEEAEEETASDEEADEEAEEEEPAPLTVARKVAYPGIMGHTGLIHTMSAQTGESMSWSFGMHLSFFEKKGFLLPDENRDVHKYIGASAHLRFSPIEYLELYASVTARSNSTDAWYQQPSLFQTIGDSTVGVKGLYTVADLYTVALAVAPRFVNSVGDTGFDWSATSVTLMLAQTFDVLAKVGFPLKIHVNLGWDFDNTQKLVDHYEVQVDEDPDDPRYITRFERYALQVNRTDFFMAGLALEFPTPWVQPFVEWNMGVPVNRQDFTCALKRYGSDDACLEQEGAAGFPMDLTMGFRFQPPPVPELAILVAADVGLTGQKRFVRETAPNEPYMIYLAASYSFVQRKEIIEIEKVVETEVIKEVEPPPPARIVGTVVDAETGEPVSGALVTVLDEEGDLVDDLSRVATDEEGVFLTPGLEAGAYVLGITADEYEKSTDCSAELEETGDVEVECELTPVPRPATIQGKVTDARNGDPLEGVEVTVEGPETRSATTDELGLFEVEVEAGDYSVVGELEDYFDKQVGIEVEPGATIGLDLPMSRVPKKKLVVVKKKQIVIKRQIQFEFDSATIKPKSYVILDWVAQVLKDNPQIELVEIQGHTDDRGTAEYNLELSQKRADAVREYLVSSGIDPDRLVAKGYGETKPLEPNVTAKGRARNRRVEFHILEQE
jgi:outer membrane protein OmpA-like peptidoglycan-associated protein